MLLSGLLLGADGENQVGQDAHQGGGGDGGQFHAKEGDHAAGKAIVAAKTDDQDD